MNRVKLTNTGEKRNGLTKYHLSLPNSTVCTWWTKRSAKEVRALAQKIEKRHGLEREFNTPTVI